MTVRFFTEDGAMSATQKRLPDSLRIAPKPTFRGRAPSILAMLFALVLTSGWQTARAFDFAFHLTSSTDTAQVGQEVGLVATLIDEGIPSPPDTIIDFYDVSESTGPFGDIPYPLCVNVPVTPVGPETYIARCLATFSDVESHELVAEIFHEDAPGQPGPITDPLIYVTVTDPFPFDANQAALTGSWYDPATSGQGLELSVYPATDGSDAGFLFGGWFTFDDAGHPRWMTLQGPLSPDHANRYDLHIYQGSGGRFDSPPIVEPVDLGWATLTFYDCGHATLTYGNEVAPVRIPYVRITQPTGCSTEVPAVPPTLTPPDDDARYSGAWYDPDTSGQGLVIDVVPAQSTIFAAWYTFAPEDVEPLGSSDQRWFVLQAAYSPGDRRFVDVPVYAVTGGVFDQPGPPVDSEPVGTADLTFTSCNTMTLDYTFTSGENAGLSGSIEERNPAPAPGCR
ncbi:MAG TPA: hypothetical protein VFP05_13185 [Thermomicrobiales bacterium]|nr:hypothetical protein [Thermomicrobiales bacterium]